MISCGRAFSDEKGVPGAKRIKKNEIVINTKIVGIASKIRLKINFNITQPRMFLMG
jgi:hypothetical protein